MEGGTFLLFLSWLVSCNEGGGRSLGCRGDDPGWQAVHLALWRVVVLPALFGHVDGKGRNGGLSWLDLELPSVVVRPPLEAMVNWVPWAGCVGAP